MGIVNDQLQSIDCGTQMEQAKRSGSGNTKTVNAIEHDKFCNFFKIPEQLCDAAFTQVIGEATPKILGEDTD